MYYLHPTLTIHLIIFLESELGDSTKSFEKLVPNKNTTGTNETDADKTYCGKCYGGEPPESGCCNTCDDVKEAYVKKGWSFNNPEGVEQVN